MPPGSANGAPSATAWRVHQVAGQHPENRIGVERRERLGGGQHGELLAFAQGQKPRRLIDLGTGQDHGRDRTAA